RSTLTISLPFLLFCLLSSLLIATVSSVNISRCDKDTVCLVNRCDGIEEQIWSQFNQDETRHPKYLESCKVIMQIKKLETNRHVIFLR
ncbi:hypothetical protein PENTCL1PPCAC_4071, partial [Pristionchus entomophagus]